MLSETPGAGPSRAYIGSPTRSRHQQRDGPSIAKEHPLPNTHFYSVEYPGFVKPTSVPLAIQHLGGQSNVDTAFRRTTKKSESTLELNFRPGNPGSHPVHGEVIGTNNILLKVVKRKKKRTDGQEGYIGEYTTEAVGVIPKTGRFRSES